MENNIFLTADKPEQRFTDFIILSHTNRQYLVTAFLGALFQLIIFKLLYPFADYFSDSYSYIAAAATHAGISIWPVGYSWLLAAFRVFTYSDTAVVSFQYLFVESAALYFFFTLLYFFSPGKMTTRIIFIFLFFNPLLLYLSNYISSDALFLGLSLLWVTQLIWIVRRPSWQQVISHGLLVAVAFTIRYNAMYFPVITALAYLLSRRSVAEKLSGIILPVLLILAFIAYSRQEAYKLTGTRQFSLFSGWQLANNALYMYPYIQVDDSSIPAECTELHRFSKKYFSIIPEKLKQVSPMDGAFYIKSPHAPLKKYLQYYSSHHPADNYVIPWGTVSATYSIYGQHLIKKHPGAFTRYFLLPNTFTYFLPPLEKLYVYNLGQGNVEKIAMRWFHYRSTSITAVSKDIQGKILFLFPTLFMLLNFAFAGAFVLFFWVRRKLPADQPFLLIIIMIGALLLANAGFSILASPGVFRYQVFPMIVLLSFALIISENVKPGLD